MIVRCLGMRKLGQTLADNLFPGPEQADLRQGLIERWAANDPHSYLASLRAMHAWSGADRIAALIEGRSER